ALLPSNAPPHHVGAPAPGANGAGSVYWFAFASHRGGAPTIERTTPPRRSTRPGCEWGRLGVLVCLRFAPRRCSYNRTRHPHPVGAPAPGANGAGSVFWFAFASHRGGAPTIERVTPPVGAPAPGANKRSPGPHQGRRSGKPNELPQACRAPCKCSLRSGRIGAFG